MAYLNSPLCHVYMAPMPENLNIAPVFPPERERYIAGTAQKELKNRRYLSWKLLEYAVGQSFGLDFQTLRLGKSPLGKWECDKLYFSLSHTEGMVAAAVSDAPVGLDMENIRVFREKFSHRIPSFLQKIAAETEQDIPPDPDAALSLWTAKESIFKLHGTGKFVPEKISVRDAAVKTCRLSLPEPAILSLCGENAASARYFLVENETLTEYQE